MTPKTGLNLERKYSINFDLPERDKTLIKFIIIHYTAMKIESKAIERLVNPKSKVSTHYFIRNDGTIINMVPDEYVAWHAGVSNWKNFKSLNKYSIGVELSNPGHNHGYKNFSHKQIVSLTKLLKMFIKEYKIKKENILGHSDIAPLRKKDPGEKFPWKKLSMHNLGRWYENENTHIKFEMSKMRELFFKNLKKLGYRYFSVYERKITDRRVVKSFQQKYLPKQVTGKIDEKTLKISHFLTI